MNNFNKLKLKPFFPLKAKPVARLQLATYQNPIFKLNPQTSQTFKSYAVSNPQMFYVTD